LKVKVTFTRIEKILEYIHLNIREPLSLDDLAAQSCWSRWQLQRVFQDYTGFSVAQYVKEIKLSQAAEQVLSGNQRMLDVAFEFGFNSEISFNRSFKQFFGVTPKRYRVNGLKTGIRTPLTRPVESSSMNFPAHALYHVRLEHKAAFSFKGVPYRIKGLRSPTPDFASSVPLAWKNFFSQVDIDMLHKIPHIGVIDEVKNAKEGELIYWAGVDTKLIGSALSELSNLEIREHSFAILPFQGCVGDFHKAITWMIASWLPDSGFQGIDDNVEIEVYYPPFDVQQTKINAEYWLPIK
jgi:AraC family transcriptional regulator